MCASLISAAEGATRGIVQAETRHTLISEDRLLQAILESAEMNRPPKGYAGQKYRNLSGKRTGG
jgi:hypothetical protein